MSFSQAEAYTRLFPGLSHVVLPKGTINLSEKNPPSDIHLLASTANLIVRKNLHPAMSYLPPGGDTDSVDRNHTLALYLAEPVEILPLVPRTPKFG
jgi:hypothetical protein